jgi:DNA-binding MarR family transcriptional regulator
MTPVEVGREGTEPVETGPVQLGHVEFGPIELGPVEHEVEAEAEEVQWLDDSEARAWRSFQQMQMRLLARLARDLGAHSGLSYQDYAVLVALTDQPEGGMRLFQLGHELGWEKSRISHQVTRMAQRGLVDKRACGSDRRGAVVVVTQAGRDEIGAAAPSHLRAVRRLFIDRLTPAQLETLADLSETVLAAVVEEEIPECAAASEDVR